ncbi:MAG: class II aldolase/adducin family protein [Spirochaetales bacterium]|nr:class II aldolase/adducin family protein [Spirochaetales bacterium]
MEREEARRQIRETGLRLLKEGLVARTWGNLSCRIEGNLFAISPTGLFYDDIGEEDIPLVSLDTLRWQGTFKPSSEKELHARLFRDHPGIGAIIHTHQPVASIAAAARIGLDRDTPCVPYALPTTSRLAKKTARMVAHDPQWSRGSLLLSNHGALCCAPSMEEALEEAINLEWKAREVIEKSYTSQCRKPRSHSSSSHLFDTFGEAYHKREEEGGRIFFQRGEQNLPDVVKQIFSLRSDKNMIIHSHTPYTQAYSSTGLILKPCLDDMAQIVGINAGVLLPGKKSVNGLLKNRDACFILNDGAYCLGADREEAKAVQAVLEKSASVTLGAVVLGGGHSISLPERFLMRMIYLKKYAPLSRVMLK